MTAVLNAANEVAVNAFLEKKIGFSDIATINRSVIKGHETGPADKIENVIAADRTARENAAKLVNELTRTAVAA